ncbi:MAG TPA: tRNA lysidine(34) synthetase TilS [Sphingomicrobium sp.]|nr:tRNA lysidine(34) synthetase TilS [Sphingomicrobium sp.]
MADRLLPDNAQLERFAAGFDPLAPPGSKLGIAVSGGPDSLALLLLASAARPGTIEAATVDHKLRSGSRAEAEMVAGLCAKLEVPHAILSARWAETPETAIQERARDERYRLLARWSAERGLDALVTAHHLDDQAETFLMRLDRGAGVRGLAGMRNSSLLPGGDLRLIRPLLGWRRTELETLCASAGVKAVMDPANRDERFERVRVRKALAQADWLDPEKIARSAGNLARADEALDWAALSEWESQLRRSGEEIAYRPSAPAEIRRRVVGRIVMALAREGRENPLRGRELARVCAILEGGGKATLRGVLCTGGEEWSFGRAPRRRKTD